MKLRLPTIRECVSAVGASVLVFAMVVVFVPDLVPDAVLDLVDVVEAQVEPWIVTLVLSLAVFAYALHRFRKSGVSEVERLVESESTMETPDFDDTDLEFDPERPGRGFDYAVARSVAQLERDPNADAWEATQVRSTLRDAVHAVRESDDRDASAVSAEIEDGSWTDDPVAAAFLGGSSAPGVSLWRRLYAWLYPARAFERRLERVVAAIEGQGTLAVEARDGEWRVAGEGEGPQSEAGDGAAGGDATAETEDVGTDSSDGSGYGRDHGDAVTSPRSDRSSSGGTDAEVES